MEDQSELSSEGMSPPGPREVQLEQDDRLTDEQQAFLAAEGATQRGRARPPSPQDAQAVILQVYRHTFL